MGFLIDLSSLTSLGRLYLGGKWVQKYGGMVVGSVNEEWEN